MNNPEQKAPDYGEPVSMEQRVSYAENALLRDIAKARSEYEILMIPKSQIPNKATLVECYETETSFVIVGTPDGDDAGHNCDAMRCCTLSHVIARIEKVKLSNGFVPDPAAAIQAAREALKELIEAFHQYEMDVDERPTPSHVRMMDRADAALALLTPAAQDTKREML